MFNIYKYTVNNQIGDTKHFFQVLVLEIVHIISLSITKGLTKVYQMDLKKYIEQFLARYGLFLRWNSTVYNVSRSYFGQICPWYPH